VIRSAFHRPGAGALGVLCMGALLTSTASARAERGEWAAGVASGALFPAFASQDATAFRLSTWMVGVQGRYGLSDDLDLTLGADWAQFAGSMNEAIMLGTPVDAVRVFSAQQIGVRAGARYKVLSGYDVAPYVEGALGYQWTIYSAQDLREVQTGRSFGVDLSDEGQGGATVMLGVAVDWRIFNLVFVGAALRVTEVFGAERYARFVTVPLELSVYW
jgi:hypothetical protein